MRSRAAARIPVKQVRDRDHMELLNAARMLLVKKKKSIQRH